MTIDGYLIPVYEYASRLSAGKSAHVLFVQEDFYLYRPEDHVNTDKTWEMKLDKHSGWSRLTYIIADYEKFGEFYPHYKNEKDENDKNGFTFSPGLLAANIKPVEWK